MAEPHDRKPILTIEQQIEHLKQKGVAFELCSEEEAADYLRDKCKKSFLWKETFRGNKKENV